VLLSEYTCTCDDDKYTHTHTHTHTIMWHGRIKVSSWALKMCQINNLKGDRDDLCCAFTTFDGWCLFTPRYLGYITHEGPPRVALYQRYPTWLNYFILHYTLQGVLFHCLSCRIFLKFSAIGRKMTFAHFHPFKETQPKGQAGKEWTVLCEGLME